jgi:3-phenylpropionate/trans-cinnamate dioxygenase ferredoxin component
MSDWFNVARLAEFPPGTRRVVEVEGLRIVVFHLDDGFYAVEDVCTHDGGELASGELIGREIICPRHGARFDLKTGAVTAPPAYEAVAVMPLRRVGDWLQVRDTRRDGEP